MHSASPTATFISVARKAVEIDGKEIQSTVFQQTVTTLSAEQPPARLQLQSQLTLQSTQTLHSAGQQPSSTPKSKAGSVPFCYLIKIYPNLVSNSYLRNAFQTLCICFQLLPQNTIEVAYYSSVSLLSRLNMLSLVSISPQVLTLTTQRLYILQYYIFYSQKAQFKAIIFIFKGLCA